jgi:Fe-S cluster assembly protein SufD
VNAQVDVKQAYLTAAAAMADALSGSTQAWVRELRERARDRFEQTGFPTTRDEAWRYTNLAPVMRQAFAPASPDGRSVFAEQLRAASFEGLKAHRLVLVGGHHRADLSDIPRAGGGVWIGSLMEAMARDAQTLEATLGRIGTPEIGPLAALNSAFLLDGAYVRVAADTTVEQVIHIVYAAAPDALISPRTLLVAGANSRATVVEHYIGVDGSRYLNNALTEVVLAPGAKLTYYRVQEEGAQGFHIGGVHVRQGPDSEFASHTIDLGGLLVRNDLRTVLAEGATCALNGLYVASGRQHVDNHTVIEHAAARSTSRELYKGVLDGRARAVFNGRVVVQPNAQKSDAEQTNNNLLLSEDAEIDTKPELEIYADDVKCSHGATVGSLDPDQLYYLRTRAVDEAAARDLLTFAFANDVLRRFQVAPLRAALDRRLVNRLLQGRAIREVELV